MTRLTTFAAATVFALSSFAAAPGLRPTPDPVRNLARVRLIVTTKAPTAVVTVAGAVVASYISSVLSGSTAVRTSHTGDRLQLSRNIAGQTAEGRFDVVLAGVNADGAITWNVETNAAAETRLEIYSLNDLDRPLLVDRFELTETAARFTTASTRLDARGQIRVGDVSPRLVLAHYYPWYTLGSWDDPQFSDRPLRPYSTDDPSNAKDIARQAYAAGIDAFAVSWQGRADRFNDRRMRVILDGAAGTGLRVCAFTETYVANPGNDPSAPTDPRSLLEWFEDIVDLYGSHPAYLRLDGRPVIFVYLATRIDSASWDDIIARLRASGRNPLLIGDFYQTTLLDQLDGEYQYTNVGLPLGDLRETYRSESLRTRTFGLLRPGDRRRIWVASVTPGYDDRHLLARSSHLVFDRVNGRLYDDQWSAAVDSGADWVIVTSWNEWFENTEIEPGERYGTYYLDRTRVWSASFKGDTDGDPRANPRQ